MRAWSRVAVALWVIVAHAAGWAPLRDRCQTHRTEVGIALIVQAINDNLIGCGA